MSQNPSKRDAIALSLTALLAASVGLFVAGLDRPIALIAYAVLIYLGATAAWQYRKPGINRASPDASDPMFLMSLVVVVAIGVRSVAVLTGEAQSIAGYLSVVRVSNLQFTGTYALAAVYGTVCWTAVLLGYRQSAHYSKPAANRSQYYPIPTTLAVLAISIMAILGWSARIVVLSINPGRLDLSQQTVSTPTVTLATAISAFCTVSLAGSLLISTQLPRQFAWSMITPLMLTEIAYSWAINDRTLLFGTVLMVLSWQGLKRPIRVRSSYLLLLPFALLFVGLTAIYRQAPSSARGLAERSRWTAHEASRSGLTGLFDESVDSVIARYHGVDSLAAILSQPPMPVPRYGLSYLLELVGPLVPRFLWTSKPNINYGIELSIHYFHRTPSTSVPMIPTWFGDLTIQFHPVFVPALCVLLGLAISALRKRALANGAAFRPTPLLYLTAIPYLVTIDGWIPIYDLMIRFLAVALLFLVLRLSIPHHRPPNGSAIPLARTARS